MDNFPVLISLNEVCARTSLSRTAINKLRAKGAFPDAVPLGDRRVGFVEEEVSEWISNRIAGRSRKQSI